MYTDSYALVTGGSRGIGAAIAKQLAKDGYNILLNYKSDDAKAENVRSEIKNIGKQCELLKFDVSDAKSVKESLQIVQKNKKIRILVNNASHTVMKSFSDTTEHDWNSIIAVVLGGFYNLTSNIVPGMIKQNDGRIINISSIGAFNADVNVAYAAAKSGLVGATRALANEMKKTSIHINSIVPGPIYTDFFAGKTKEEVSLELGFKIGDPQDIANMVSFLCSDKADYINGQVLHINGGMYI